MYISIRPDLGPKRQQEKLLSSSENLGILDVRIDLIREAKDVEEAINPVDGKFQGAGAHKVVGTAIWHLSLMRATERCRWSISTSKTEHIEQLVPEDEARQKYLRDFTVHHSIPPFARRDRDGKSTSFNLCGVDPVYQGRGIARRPAGALGFGRSQDTRWAGRGPEIEYAVDAQGDDVERPSIIFMRRMAA
ncbi:hypothetical protein E4U22_007522 [Claviceps purpurea]|nr:hypothetical protein E4U22_007522 [Claviceps purpurea]